jgi:homoaconitate hydratase
MSGELLLVPKDNLNTDGMYGKEYTYKTLPPEEMAKVAMANYDPEFQALARQGDLLVGGYNFGSGSSREQAATALKFRGLQLIIAGSFSQTYSRNAFNNGYVCLECPRLVDDLRAAHKASSARTIRTGWHATVDFTRSEIAVQHAGGSTTYGFPPLGPVAQELIVHGGFEAVIRKQLEKA